MIRRAALADANLLHRIAEEAGMRREPGYFERALNEGRAVFIAGQDEGSAQLVWNPTYQPFRRLDIPEIQDVAVIPAARRKGLGALLVAACEAEAKRAGKTDIGLGVGLTSNYGAAQRLYVRLGYVPDGTGVCYDEAGVKPGEIKPVDDLLTLKLVKAL